VSLPSLTQPLPSIHCPPVNSVHSSITQPLPSRYPASSAPLLTVYTAALPSRYPAVTQHRLSLCPSVNSVHSSITQSLCPSVHSERPLSALSGVPKPSLCAICQLPGTRLTVQTLLRAQPQVPSCKFPVTATGTVAVAVAATAGPASALPLTKICCLCLKTQDQGHLFICTQSTIAAMQILVTCQKRSIGQ
jgi:hypothetical protein